MKDTMLSREAAEKVEAAAKECFRNAFVTADLFGGEYVEGWAVHDEENAVAFEHAWVKQGDTILDPTLPDKAVAYFEGLVFTLDEVRRMSPKGLLPVVWNTRETLNLEPYRTAQYLALQFARSKLPKVKP